MFPVTRRFLANLRLARWRSLVEWSLDGVTWHPSRILDGKVTADAGSQVCWGLDAVLDGVPVGRSALSPFGPLLRASVGLAYTPEDVEWVPLGTYRCETTLRSKSNPERVTVTGASLEAAVIGERFYAPRVIPPASARQTVEALIREAVPEALVSWQVDDDPMPQIITEKDRWAIIDGDRDASSIARALAARCRTDGRGVFVMQPGPTLQDAPVWHVTEGASLVDSTEKLSRGSTYNAIVVTGNADDGSPPVGPGIAEDLEPTSPTFVGRSPLRGGFGRVPRFYASPLLRTQVACERAARTQLADYLGLAQEVTFEAVPNYALEVSDVVVVDTPAGAQPNILDKIEYSLTTPAVSASTRATATRFAGDLSALPNTSEEAA